MNGKDSIGTVSLTFKEGIELEAVHQAVEELIRGLAPGGCTACGFLGLDLIIRGGDPEFFAQLNAVRATEGVLDVSVVPRQVGF